jgi:hypothetical protein
MTGGADHDDEIFKPNLMVTSWMCFISALIEFAKGEHQAWAKE